MYILVIQIMLANTCILITRREERDRKKGRESRKEGGTGQPPRSLGGPGASCGRSATCPGARLRRQPRYHGSAGRGRGRVDTGTSGGHSARYLCSAAASCPGAAPLHAPAAPLSTARPSVALAGRPRPFGPSRPCPTQPEPRCAACDAASRSERPRSGRERASEPRASEPLPHAARRGDQAGLSDGHRHSQSPLNPSVPLHTDGPPHCRCHRCCEPQGAAFWGLGRARRCALQRP